MFLQGKGGKVVPEFSKCGLGILRVLDSLSGVHAVQTIFVMTLSCHCCHLLLSHGRWGVSSGGC